MQFTANYFRRGVRCAVVKFRFIKNVHSGNVNGGMGSIDGAVGQHYVTSKSVDSAFTTYGNYSYLFDYYDL